VATLESAPCASTHSPSTSRVKQTRKLRGAADGKPTSQAGKLLPRIADDCLGSGPLKPEPKCASGLTDQGIGKLPLIARAVSKPTVDGK
jgi:hypothetical protein